MRTFIREQMILNAALNKGRDAVALAVATCTEGDFVSGRLLKTELESAGYEVVETPRKVLTRVDVNKDGARVAYGESHDAGDALLQAITAYLRELPVVEEVKQPATV
jgi:hypothetical protein